MIEALVGGLFALFEGSAFLFLLIGILIGLVVGLVPGLGGPVALALMLPFTYGMTPVEAFAFLLGMASVTAITGDLTAIVFGVPGEPTAAALVVDGHPMAKKGQAGRAMGAALMSSLIGALIGAVTLALAVPVIRPVVLAFGSPEFFVIVIIGIAFISALSTGAVVRGLIAGAIGLLLATIGTDPQSGIPRYTFGQLSLWDGVGLVPVIIGLFALPEIVDLAVRGTSISGKDVGRIGGVLDGVKETFRHWALTIRCSVIGTLVGIMPGMGGAVAQWLAYSHAVQSSQGKERFGQGAIEGVIGPGAANNSKEGGSLIPTIAFGIPGSVTMAILLGAFLIQGLTPGPGMLTTNIELTMSFVWMLVIANVIGVGLSFLLLGQILKLTTIRGGLIIPVIVVLILVGAFTERNLVLDLGIALAAGVLGLAMTWLGWPRPPLVLGLVLGGLAENYLFISTARYGAEWLSRPIVLILLAVLFIGLVGPVFSRRLRRLADESGGEGGAE